MREASGGGRGDLGGRARRNTAVRLFLTCWIVYVLHFATDIVREHYPAMALADHFSLRLDEYAGLHPDLFDTGDRGWRQGNNPGASFLAAIPYALARPLIDPLVARVRHSRQASGAKAPPSYDTPWPRDRRFFEEAWLRGIDVKLGLASFVMQAFFMAPLCALSVVAMFYVLGHVLGPGRTAVWLTLLYALGTPLFYRAAYLNHNMALGVIAFLAFVAIWDPGGRERLSRRGKFLVGGLAGGTTVLFDYSGLVFFVGLFAYALACDEPDVAPTAVHPGESRDRWPQVLRGAWWYGLGAVLPISLLLVYQWQSFGNPFLPGQHWMPPVEWVERGYRGYGWPQGKLLLALSFDYRYGLFTSCPLLLLAFAAPFRRQGFAGIFPRREIWFGLGLFAALLVFFSGNNYTRLQWVTGVRYMVPIVPFLFLGAAVVIARLPGRIAYLLGVLSVALTWCLVMYREVQLPLGVLDPVLRTLVGGLDLPALRTLERMGDAYGGFATNGTSPVPLFLLAAAIIFGIWRFPRRARPEKADGS